MRWIAGALVLAGVAGALAVPHQREFPHAAHEGLFPLCTGCHVGIPEGDTEAFYPDPEECMGCHEEDPGTVEDFYAAPAPSTASSLRFSHPEHPNPVDGEELTCNGCHGEPGAARMAVEPARPDRCLACHAHEASSHTGDADCAACHVPLAETAFRAARVRSLPVPEDHVQSAFLRREHGSMAAAEPQRCSVCHTRERCESCHVDPSVAPEIASIPAAGSALELPGFPAHYFTPDSHLAGDFWLGGHGAAANDIAECATCHTRNDCTVCHTTAPPPPIEQLPERTAVQAPGVLLARKAPASHAMPAFETTHGGLAVAADASCEACHSRRSCENCHNAPADATFHPADFVTRHATDAYGGRLECQSCHDVGTFCRDCHTQAGMEGAGRLGPGFHDAQATWLLRHGQAARQALETCASCHAQTDCVQCHSQTGAFQISPHGPDFDAERLWERNAVICTACHLTDPLGRSP